MARGFAALESMYLYESPLSRGAEVLAGVPLPPKCPPDEPISSGAALLYSPHAQLAEEKGAHCDHRAVWTFVPSPLPDRLFVLVYLHGFNNFVTASAASPGGRPASWAGRHRPPTFPPGTRGGPYASGPKYQLDVAAQMSRQRPIVIVPEDAFGPSKKLCKTKDGRLIPCYWAVTRPGKLASDPGLLGNLIVDCLARLKSLRKPGDSTYLPAGVLAAGLRRLFLAGHSGGGVPLAHAALSSLALTLPTDLWLLDSTYNPGLNRRFVEFCRRWKFWVDPTADGFPLNRLGNDHNSSRMVIITLGRTTALNAKAIIDELQGPWSTAAGRFPGMTAARFTRGALRPYSGTAVPASPEIVEVMPDASFAEVERCLRTAPVVFVHTKVEHDRIPLEYIPRLLRTGAVP